MLGNRAPVDRAPALIRWRSQLRARSLNRHGLVSSWVATPHGRVRTLSRGRPHPHQATWVFLHGFADEATGWAPLLDPLGPRLGRVVAIDLPGHGRSDVPACGLTPDSLLGGLFAAVGRILAADEPLVLVGNSMGGAAAIRVAQHLAPQVRALVLLSPAGAPMTGAEIEAVVALFTLDSAAKALALADTLMPGRLLLRQLAAQVLRRHMNRPVVAGLMRSFGDFTWLTAAEVAALPPALLVWGQHDQILPTTGEQFFRRHLSAERARCEAPPDWGHTPQLDRPRALARLIVDWARGHRGLLPGAGR